MMLVMTVTVSSDDVTIVVGKAIFMPVTTDYVNDNDEGCGVALIRRLWLPAAGGTRVSIERAVL